MKRGDRPRRAARAAHEIDGTEVLMRKEGDRLILAPIRKNRLLDLLASWQPLDEGTPEVEDLPLQDRADSEQTQP